MPMGGIFHSSPELPAPLMASDFYINTKESSERAGVLQQSTTTHQDGSACAVVIFLSNQMKCNFLQE